MTFADILETLGEKLGIELEDAGGAAAIEIDGTPVILQDAGDMLLLRADLGQPPPEDVTMLYKSALEADFLYQGTGGATIAINPADGHFNIHRYNWLERLDADAAVETLEKFAETVAAWRRIVADYRAGAEAKPQTAGQPGVEPPPGLDLMQV